MKFNELFKEITPKEICDNVFTLVGEEFAVVTSGKKDNYNSMIASGGGLGLVFKKPSTFLIFRKDRYTLELIKKEHTYTLSYFPKDYNEQVLFLGSKSGRDSRKMKEVKLRSVQTPLGDICFEEARLIIQCKLTQITTPRSDDFYGQEAKEYIKEAYKTSRDYRQYVYGEITNVWVKK